VSPRSSALRLEHLAHAREQSIGNPVGVHLETTFADRLAQFSDARAIDRRCRGNGGFSLAMAASALPRLDESDEISTFASAGAACLASDAWVLGRLSFANRLLAVLMLPSIFTAEPLSINPFP